ncbi:MAG TPA: hypothetical protein VGL81_01955 [Polyangiaceae bacterium]
MMTGSSAFCVLRSALFLVVLALSLSRAGPAQALGPLDVEVGAKAGAGSNPIGGGFPNPLGPGVGGRAGVALAGLYAGVSAMYYAGVGTQKLDVIDGTNFERGAVSPHSFLFGGELGYGVTLGGLVLLRAQVGLGDDVLGMSGGVALGSTIDNIVSIPQAVPAHDYLYLEPGITALVEVGKVYAGLDGNVLLLPSGPRWPPSHVLIGQDPFPSSQTLDSAVTVHAQLGLRF